MTSRHVGQHNPFVEPDFVLPSMRPWSAADIGVLRVMDGTAWLAAVPVVSQASWRVESRPLSCDAWRHADTAISAIAAYAGGDAERVARHSLRRAHRHAGGFGLEWIATDGPFGWTRCAAAVAWSNRQFDRAALHRGPGEGWTTWHGWHAHGEQVSEGSEGCSSVRPVS